MNDEIPALRAPDQMPPIRDDHDLLNHWRALMGELGFSERLLWVLFVGSDGMVAPHVMQVAELPTFPDEECLDGLGYVCAQTLQHFDDLTAVAMLLSRPGSGPISDSDRTWAAGVTRVTQQHGVSMHRMHLANDERLRVVAADDLIGAV